MEEFFKSIENQYQKKLPFVVYRKPLESKVRALFQSNTHVHSVLDFSEKGFVFAPFDEQEQAIIIPFENFQEIEYESLKIVSTIKAYNQDNAQKKRYLNIIQKALSAIDNDDFKKVVLSRKEEITLKNKNPIEIFKRLINVYHAAFIYCWYHPNVGLWLGATPETLINIEGNQFSVMALAATQEFKGSLNVSWNNKEIDEQESVTKFIVDRLEPLSESMKISAANTIKAGNLLHLKTMISSKLKSGLNLRKVIKTIHPTPAVCGMPKKVARQFILENENYDREFYTGFLGELNFERVVKPRGSKRNIENRAYISRTKVSQLYVNLRCAKIEGCKASIYVGGGITKQSKPELEWEETVFKSSTMKSVL